MSWRPPALDGQNGVITSYTVVFIEAQSNNTLTYQREGEFAELVIEQLHPYYDYHCSIAAGTRVGHGLATDPVTIRTLEDGKDFICTLLSNFSNFALISKQSFRTI